MKAMLWRALARRRCPTSVCIARRVAREQTSPFAPLVASAAAAAFHAIGQPDPTLPMQRTVSGWIGARTFAFGLRTGLPLLVQSTESTIAGAPDRIASKPERPEASQTR